MSILLPRGLPQAFRAAASELGHAGAAALFVEEIAREHGTFGIDVFRDEIGREYAVADAVAGRWLTGWRPSPIDATAVVGHLTGIRRVVVVGLEAPHLDALVDALPDRQIAILTWSAIPADWERVVANQRGRVEAVDLDTIFSWAGPDSAVVCFVYGGDDGQVFAPPAWLRLNGPDMRPRFRTLIAWNVVPVPFSVYSRWFHEVQVGEFTALEST